MARSKKRSRSITFQHSTSVEVRPAEFTLLASVRHLDALKLAKAASARIEVGYFQTDCCRQMVQAIVRNGIVTHLALEPCEEEMGEPASPELVRVFQLARKRVAKPGRPFRPMPVATFLSNAANISVDSITCVRICIYGFCIVCCTTMIPNAPIVCGKKVIIVTK